MRALTTAPSSPSPDPRSGSSWAARAGKVRVERPPDARLLSLSFRDLRVCARDVITIGEAFARCSPESLLNAVMRQEAGWRIPVDAVGSHARHMLMGKIAGALETMRSLEDAVVALSPSHEGIVGPLFRFSSVEGGTGFDHEVGAAVLSADDGAVIEECLASGLERACTWDALRMLYCGAEGSLASDAIGPEALHASHAVLARMPWERVLALPLWLPEDLSDDEREGILAKVFWSMTYRGFVQGERQQDALGVRMRGTARRLVRSEPVPWPADPVLAVLGHNCWVDTLEAWNALFAVIRPRETRP